MVRPVVSKLYCSSSEKVFMVRRRPRVVNGGGFVVVDCNQKVVFKVDGCGILGNKQELVLRDGDGDDVLLIRRKGGIVEALSLSKKWKGYTSDLEGLNRQLVFILKVPINSCLINKSVITIEPIEPKEEKNRGQFIVTGDFPARDCSILDSRRDVIAQDMYWDGTFNSS